MRILLTGILFTFSAIVFGQDKECLKFKEGKFKIIINDTVTSIIERTGTKQIEYAVYNLVIR